MKQFEIDGTTYNLKNNWEDLLFSDWLEFQRLEKTKEVIGIDENYIIKVLQILTTCSEQDILNIDLEELNGLMKSIEFMNTPIPKVETKYLEFGGVKWAFKKDLQKLTMGEYISLKTFQENSKDELQSTCMMLSVLLRRVKEEKEDGELVLESFKPDECKKIGDMLVTYAKMIDIYHYLTFFFDSNETSTITDTAAYSVVQALEAQKLAKSN